MSSTSGEDEQDLWSGLAFDGEGRLIDTAGPVEPITWGEPPVMRWVPIEDVPGSVGARVCLMTPEGPEFDHRAVSEVFSDETGGWFVHIAHEAQWWDWVHQKPAERADRVPRATCWPTRHVWVEQRA